MKLFYRSILMILPMIIIIFASIVRLIITGASQFIDWTFGKPNYWDISNEWHQVKEDAKNWYDIWRYGFGDF